ncbi:MarR family transcriptional regulator [Rhodovastum atsumiense]|uniref:MarR family transcriptional regulator n=1 Tax=Rhodovastum atsumiense TaxID=504468 RepID=A0A5M6ISE9_9PROT|nr:MarR family transcriptional regulator [Rhodovastum atsumiense]KAA5611234.1 MarR family transcriptional regulator [Rhodovastum atsumiense]CAH2602538.1 MarR family transcriptional regulator [Rhodovastum atsumiense]
MRKPSNAAQPPGPGEGKRGEDGYLGYLLRQAAGAYRHRMDRELADLDVTPPQFAVMTMVNAYPGISNADIARLALLTPQTVSVIVANLQRGGIVQRVPHDVHGRILRIALTPSGQALLQQCRTRVQALEDELSGGLSEADQGVIRKWLAGIARGDGLACGARRGAAGLVTPPPEGAWDSDDDGCDRDGTDGGGRRGDARP